MRMNVLKYRPYSRHYYLTHPWKYISVLGRRCKYAWQRITKGYCMIDKWDFDKWFLEILPTMLDDLADTCTGYPGNKEFPTMESWRAYIHQIASDLRLCTDDAADKMNEYYEDFFNSLHGLRSIGKTENGEVMVRCDEPSELSKNYFDRCKEIAREQEAIREEALIRLSYILPLLWD